MHTGRSVPPCIFQLPKETLCAVLAFVFQTVSHYVWTFLINKAPEKSFVVVAFLQYTMWQNLEQAKDRHFYCEKNCFIS